VAECTGVEKLIDDAINYVRRGGSLLVYGVYEDKALVHWPPGKIFGDEINVGRAVSSQSPPGPRS
jgi:D-arabinitol dehydrogenase (NADP+)